MRAYLTVTPALPAQQPQPIAMQRVYLRKANVATGNNLAAWTITSQGAECLYLIVSTMHDGDKNALDFFMPGEIGDVDGDGMREILDAWGRPIEFLRWAPGFRNDPGTDLAWGIAGTDDDNNGTIDDFSELGAANSDDVVRLTTQRPDLPDPFDPLKVATGAFALRPLIFSGGRDKSFDIFTDNVPTDSPPAPAAAIPYRYCPPGAPADNNYPNPYGPFNAAAGYYAGMTMDRDGSGTDDWADNITNHFQPTTAP
jgi:hypothetical protein